MKLPVYQLDAFTDTPFKGNPAAVCPLDAWLDDEILQAIAVENNLSETAYFVPGGEGADHDFHLRWFTPGCEVDLCGHATLASAKVILDHVRSDLDEIRFLSLSGILTVRRQDNRLELDFPNRAPEPVSPPDGLVDALGVEPAAILGGGRDFLLVFSDEQVVAGLTPDFGKLGRLGSHGFIATAPGKSSDFVSRFFAPAYGIDEDPVTGSAHCYSAPYWAERLGKAELFARQISPRGGELWLTVVGDRVRIAGQCVEVMRGELQF